jgi:4-diphosphocytidyl-2-C-methyl-D-erythritol kinase
MVLERFAPAKINLFLHVGPLGEDGYHPLCSLMVFADVGDWVRLLPGEAAGLHLEGPFAGSLALSGGAGSDNLILRSRDLFQNQFGPAPGPFRLVLEKNLPIASGVGGGSADAAATLALLAAYYQLPAEAVGDLRGLAKRLGADVPACLLGESVIAQGRGDELSPAVAFPAVHAVLVNPGLPTATSAVYGAFDQQGFGGDLTPPHAPRRPRNGVEMAIFLRAQRNDLERAAVAVQPAIAAVLESLAGAPETLIARMSGSGATCFALCETSVAARVLARSLAAANPSWWVRACRLGAPPRR